MTRQNQGLYTIIIMCNERFAALMLSHLFPSAERDLRSLFVSNFPDDTTEETLKALSNDIIEVRLRVNHKRGERTRA